MSGAHPKTTARPTMLSAGTAVAVAGPGARRPGAPSDRMGGYKPRLIASSLVGKIGVISDNDFFLNNDY